MVVPFIFKYFLLSADELGYYDDGSDSLDEDEEEPTSSKRAPKKKDKKGRFMRFNFYVPFFRKKKRNPKVYGREAEGPYLRRCNKTNCVQSFKFQAPVDLDKDPDLLACFRQFDDTGNMDFNFDIPGSQTDTSAQPNFNAFWPTEADDTPFMDYGELPSVNLEPKNEPKAEVSNELVLLFVF